MNSKITLVTEPTIIPLAEMRFMPEALEAMYNWVAQTHQDCFSGEFLAERWYADGSGLHVEECLFPHGTKEWGTPLTHDSVRRTLTDNELLVELSGRLCYMSFGLKAGTPTNRKYIENTQQGTIPHRSLMYHPKMSFFISGVSRRLTHELIRHYVGADRSEEGSPSQASTRYVEHPGWFVVHPYILDHARAVGQFNEALATYEFAMQRSYHEYLAFIEQEMREAGGNPKGLARKRIYEAASSYLPHSAMTSLVWTTNPAALAKLFLERTDEAADLEFQRLAKAWQGLCRNLWPNLFLEKAL